MKTLSSTIDLPIQQYSGAATYGPGSFDPDQLSSIWADFISWIKFGDIPEPVNGDIPSPSSLTDPWAGISDIARNTFPSDPYSGAVLDTAIGARQANIDATNKALEEAIKSGDYHPKGNPLLDPLGWLAEYKWWLIGGALVTVFTLGAAGVITLKVLK